MKNAAKEYLFLDVSGKDEVDEVFIVQATSKKEAICKIAKKKMRLDDCFLKNVADKSVNLCFAERFFFRKQ